MDKIQQNKNKHHHLHRNQEDLKITCANFIILEVKKAMCWVAVIYQNKRSIKDRNILLISYH